MTRPDDRDLDQLLADDGGQWGALYRKLSRVEPPRRLDRNVLDEAARAVRGHVPRRQRWLLGIGSAAGLVLAAGVAWHVGQDALTHSPMPTAPAPAAAKPHRNYVPVEPIRDSARRATPKAEAAPEPAPVASPPPAQPVVAKPRKRAEASPAPPAPPPPSMDITAATPAPAAATPAPAAPKAAFESVNQGVSHDNAAKALRTDKAPVDAEAAAPRGRAIAPTELNRSAEVRADITLAPDAWIRRIQWLLDEGREQQALESLRLLRRTHPGVELPDDLKSLQ